MDRGKAWAVAAAIALALVIGGIAVAGQLLWEQDREVTADCDRYRFDSAQWKSDQRNADGFSTDGDQLSRGQRMALELKKCRVLDGATRDEVENLLGRPPDWQSDDNWRDVDLWYYTVGPIDGVFGPKSSGNEELVVAFGTDDRVTKLYFENTE